VVHDRSTVVARCVSPLLRVIREASPSTPSAPHRSVRRPALTKDEEDDDADDGNAIMRPIAECD